MFSATNAIKSALTLKSKDTCHEERKEREVMRWTAFKLLQIAAAAAA